MIGAMARHRVQVLRAAGLPQARIAAIEGISERSVRTICSEAPIEDPRDVLQVQARERDAVMRGGSELRFGEARFGGYSSRWTCRHRDRIKARRPLRRWCRRWDLNPHEG